MKKIELLLNVIRAIRIAIGSIIVIAMGLTIIIGMASCSKENNLTPAPATSFPVVAAKKVNQISYSYNGSTSESETMTYDAQGRLATYTEDDHTSSFTYTSATKLEVTRRKKSDNSIDRIYDCIMNSHGAITEMLFKENNVIKYTYLFEYNSDGFLTKLKGINPGYTYEEYFEIVDGNVASSKLYYDGVQSSNRQYSPDNTKPNKTFFSTWSYWPSATLFGKPSKYHLKEFKDFNMNNTLTWHTKYMIEADTQGYPVKITTDFILQGTKGITDYSFQ
jgi:YD repeat-containing protein